MSDVALVLFVSLSAILLAGVLRLYELASYWRERTYEWQRHYGRVLDVLADTERKHDAERKRWSPYR